MSFIVEYITIVPAYRFLMPCEHNIATSTPTFRTMLSVQQPNCLDPRSYGGCRSTGQRITMNLYIFSNILLDCMPKTYTTLFHPMDPASYSSKVAVWGDLQRRSGDLVLFDPISKDVFCVNWWVRFHSIRNLGPH
jgi:hypothetical protein